MEANIPKYEIEMANAARLLSLNSSTQDSKLGTFLFSIETVGIEENLTCVDPVRRALSYSIILRLGNVPNTYQSAHTTKCHLSEKMTWMSMYRSHAVALSLQTLGEYCASLHTDIIHSVGQAVFSPAYSCTLYTGNSKDHRKLW